MRSEPNDPLSHQQTPGNPGTERVIPTVRRHYLFALAGLFWTIAGGILCIRGSIWLLSLVSSVGIAMAAGSVLLAAVAYIFGFSKIVRKNIERIHRLPDRASIFAFTPLRGYVMIFLMMTLGITLRNSSLPKYYLIVPYLGMGGVLLIGSVRFYFRFFTSVRRISVEELKDSVRD